MDRAEVVEALSPFLLPQGAKEIQLAVEGLDAVGDGVVINGEQDTGADLSHSDTSFLAGLATPRVWPHEAVCGAARRATGHTGFAD